MPSLNGHHMALQLYEKIENRCSRHLSVRRIRKDSKDCNAKK
jgi:hypothetical protein